MGHLSISKLNKKWKSKNFHRFKIFKSFNIWTRLCFDFFLMVKIIKIPSGFELMTYSSVFKVFFLFREKNVYKNFNEVYCLFGSEIRNTCNMEAPIPP